MVIDKCVLKQNVGKLRVKQKGRSIMSVVTLDSITYVVKLKCIENTTLPIRPFWFLRLP